MSDGRISDDALLRVYFEEGEVWARTGSFWLPLGARLEVKGHGCGGFKVVSWLKVAHLADERLRRILANEFHEPPDAVIDAAIAAGTEGWLFELVRT